MLAGQEDRGGDGTKAESADISNGLVGGSGQQEDGPDQQSEANLTCFVRGGGQRGSRGEKNALYLSLRELGSAQTVANSSLPGSSRSPLQGPESQLLRGPGPQPTLASPSPPPLPRRLLSLRGSPLSRLLGGSGRPVTVIELRSSRLARARHVMREKVWVCVDRRQKTPFWPKDISLKPRGNAHLSRSLKERLWPNSELFKIFFLKTSFIFLSLRRCYCLKEAGALKDVDIKNK